MHRLPKAVVGSGEDITRGKEAKSKIENIEFQRSKTVPRQKSRNENRNI